MQNTYPHARFWLTVAIGTAALAGTGWLGYVGRSMATFGYLTGCFLAGMLVNLPAIESFALTRDGLNAKMRVALDEAMATMEQLRALATSTARSSLTQSMAALLGPRTMPISTRLRLDMKVIGELRRLEVTSDQMEEARELWDRGIGVLFGRKLEQLIGVESIARHQPEINPRDHSTHFIVARPILEARAALLQSIDFDEWRTPPAEVWRDLCVRAGGVIPGSDALLTAYEDFLETRMLSAPELLDPTD